MDKIPISLKPIFWRLLIWRSFSSLIVIGIAVLLSKVAPVPSFARTFSTVMISTVLGTFTVQVIASLVEWFNKKLHIEVTEGKIIGPKPGLTSEPQKIYTNDLARTSLLEKSAYQKFFGLDKLCSTRGEIIVFSPFVYEKASVDEFYKALQIIQDENPKDKKQKTF